MIGQLQTEDPKSTVQKMLRDQHIAITLEETARIEVADFGLNDLSHVGLQLLTYINTERVCAKELILFPGQTCPEHYHPPVSGEPGKEEIFRCRSGDIYLYVSGEPTPEPTCAAPVGYEKYFTVWHEVHLTPGEQHTILPETKHWFQAGREGAIVSEFSTRSRDEFDVFTDPQIVR